MSEGGAAEFLNKEMCKNKDRYDMTLPFCVNKNVCDIACGVGWGTFKISEVAKFVFGFDISDKNIELAKKHWSAKNIEYKVIDFEKNFDGQYDVIVSMETIEHLSIPLSKSIDIYNKNLIKNGILCLSHPENERNKSDYHNHIKIKHEHMKDLLVSKGFEILEQKLIEDNTGNLIIVRKI